MTQNPDTQCFSGSSCLPMMDDEGCPAACMPECRANEEHCHIYDSNGCIVDTICVAAGETCNSPYDEDGCLVVSNPSCGEGQQFCVGGRDEDDCPMSGTCVSSTEACPPPCSLATEMICSKGSYHNLYLGDFCVDTAEYSQLWQNVMCFTHCPAACEWSDLKACGGGYDDITGCPYQDTCRDISVPCNAAVEGSCFEEEIDYTYAPGNMKAYFL